jgi:alanyl-tRNA synthetase
METYDKIMKTVNKRFNDFSFPLVEDTNIIPNDSTTNFVCSGMQQIKNKFITLDDGSKYGSVQTCIRTNDLEKIGDGIHLSSFKMLGNFQFGGNEYNRTIDLWHSILTDLNIHVSYITVHPSQTEHQKLWELKGYNTKLLEENIWSDGEIGGYCCEVFVGDLEIGNLVHTLGKSVDVGFGLERIVQVLEGKIRVDDTSLFRIDLPPLFRDHIRTLKIFHENNIFPGGKGRNYICKLLLRNLLDFEINEKFVFSDWLENERIFRNRRFIECKKGLKKKSNLEKSNSWWFETYGVNEKELEELKHQI